MKIEKSFNMGFCPGVNSSIKLINKIIAGKKYKKIYMLGEIIHNEIVIKELEQKGLSIIKDFNKIPQIKKNDILIIQSHGVSPDIYKKLRKKNIKYIDSTCPLVKVIHRAISNLEKEGFYPVIIGNKYHTEVIGISGYANNKPIIISKKEEVKKGLFKNVEKAGIVFQSTFIKEKADEIISEIKKYIKNVKVSDTICAPTKNRQKEVREKSKKFDAVIVIGSKNSSNTTKLYQIAKSQNKNTFFVHNSEDLHSLNLTGYKSYFVTSGASTPDYIIDKCIDIIKKQTNKFYDFSKKYIPVIDNYVKNFFDAKSRELKNKQLAEILQTAKEYCLRPGKRIRPVLLINSYLGFFKTTQINEIIKISASIEIMHSFLLIHDDIMDKALMRRGETSFHIIMNNLYKKKTLNENIGADIGIVVGDILFTLALKIIAESKIDINIKNIFLKYFSKCYEITSWGQILDSLSSQIKEFDLKKSIPQDIAAMKTAYYTIFYPLVMGYILTGGKNNNVIEKIKKFALPLGIAFQIRDDILGMFGAGQITGKSTVSDIMEGKFTFLISKTIELASAHKRDIFKKLFLKKRKTLTDIENIKKIIKNSGALDSSIKKMNFLFDKALKNLNEIKMKKSNKDILKDMIDVLRTKKYG